MIFVLADDITGAAEIAGLGLRYGLGTSFGIDAIPEKLAEINIIATDTRSMEEYEAYATHKNLAEQIKALGDYAIFKKCDSVLRGYVLTELCAIAQVFGKKRAVLQPANPESRRCIRDGVYWIGKQRLEETGFSTDPDFPKTTSYIKNILLNRVTRHTKIIHIYTGDSFKINVEGVIVPDCNAVSDLTKSLLLYNDASIIAGSAAFFEQFLIKKYGVSAQVKPKINRFNNNYVLLSGSTHPESVAFAQRMKDKGCPLLVMPDILLKDQVEEDNISQWIKTVSETYATHKKLVLRTSNTIIQFENSSKILKQRMSHIIKGLFDTSEIKELCIEGGASAYSVLQTLNWTSFTPVAELAPGVVRMQYDIDSNKYITIKPGSYVWPSGLLMNAP